jgi:hypothetical protein
MELEYWSTATFGWSYSVCLCYPRATEVFLMAREVTIRTNLRIFWVELAARRHADRNEKIPTLPASNSSPCFVFYLLLFLVTVSRNLKLRTNQINDKRRRERSLSLE